MSLRDYRRSYKGTGMSTREKGRLVAAEATRRIRAQRLAAKRGTFYKSVPRTRGALAGRVETKYYDCFKVSTNLAAVTTDWTNTEYDPASTASQNCLFAPSQGTDITQRIGRKVLMRKLKMRGQISFAMGTADSPCQVRYIIYVDTQTNGTQAQGEQVMAYAGNGAPAAANAMNFFMSTANFGRFKILKDKTMTAVDTNPAVGGAAGQLRVLPLKCNIKLNIPVEFNAGNTGTVTDIVNNSLHIIVACNSIAGTPAIQYVSRVSFIDN